MPLEEAPATDVFHRAFTGLAGSLTVATRTHRGLMQSRARAVQQHKSGFLGTFLAVQWLELHVSNARCSSSIPGQGTRIPHAAKHLLSSQSGQALFSPLVGLQALGHLSYSVKLPLKSSRVCRGP